MSAGPITAAALIERLGLVPHPEGGHFREVHRSAQTVRRGADERAAITTIDFLLAAGEHGRWHVVASDEVWHHLAGEPLELVLFDPARRVLERRLVGPVDRDGCTAVAVAPAGWWQAARPLGAFALVGCTVGPGFSYDDFRFVAELPGHDATFEGALALYRGLL